MSSVSATHLFHLLLVISFRLNVKMNVCHNKFISGYLKSKDLNDTNEPQCSSKVDRICRKMPQKVRNDWNLALIKKT